MQTNNQKIEKQLKYGSFVYDTAKDEFWVTVVNSKTGIQYSLPLSKVYAFALSRFVTRISQRNWLRKKVKHNDRL